MCNDACDEAEADLLPINFSMIVEVDNIKACSALAFVVAQLVQPLACAGCFAINDE